MKQLTQKLCGALLIFPVMLWAQEDVEKTKEKELTIEWKMEGEIPEGLEEDVMTIIKEELSGTSEASNVKVFMLDGKDLEDIEIISEEDEDGNVKITKYVNGKEVPVEEGEDMFLMDIKSFDGKDLDFDLEDIEIISEKDEDGNVKITKYVNGKEVPVGEGEDMFLMDIKSFEGKFLENEERIEKLTEMLEKTTLDCKEIQKEMSELDLNSNDVHSFFSDVNVIKELDENGVEKVRVFMNGEEVEDADFPVMGFNFSEDNFFPEGDDVKVIMIRKEVFIDTIGEDEETPKNLKVSKEPLELEEISMFPNPNNGIFTLKMNSASDAKVMVRILNVEGKTIYNKKLKPSGGLCTQEIDISVEGKGIYFLNIEQKGKYLSRKIIVQ